MYGDTNFCNVTMRAGHAAATMGATPDGEQGQPPSSTCPLTLCLHLQFTVTVGIFSNPPQVYCWVSGGRGGGYGGSPGHNESRWKGDEPFPYILFHIISYYII